MMKDYNVSRRKAYAARRVTLAFNRFRKAQVESDKEFARTWTRLWGIVAGYWLSRHRTKR